MLVISAVAEGDPVFYLMVSHYTKEDGKHGGKRYGIKGTYVIEGLGLGEKFFNVEEDFSTKDFIELVINSLDKEYNI